MQSTVNYMSPIVATFVIGITQKFSDLAFHPFSFLFAFDFLVVSK